jgi:hypothetical protein
MERISRLKRFWREYVSPNIYGVYNGIGHVLPFMHRMALAPFEMLYPMAEVGAFAATGPVGPIVLNIATVPVRWAAHNPVDAIRIGASTTWTIGFVVGLTSKDIVSLDSYVNAGLAAWDASGNLSVAGPEVLAMFGHLLRGNIISFGCSGLIGGLETGMAIYNMGKMLYYAGKLSGVNVKNVGNLAKSVYEYLSYINKYVSYPLWNGVKWIYRNIVPLAGATVNDV